MNAQAIEGGGGEGMLRGDDRQDEGRGAQPESALERNRFKGMMDDHPVRA